MTSAAEVILTPTSPGFSPHALQLHVIPVPFWGVPAPVPKALADNYASTCATSLSPAAVIKQLPTNTTVTGTSGNPTAAGSASATATSATATAYVALKPPLPQLEL